MQKTKELKGYRKHLSRMVISAMFLALAIVVNLFSEISIPLFGADGMQVKFGGLFTAFPAFLFGPWYGGVVCALSDIIGTLIKPLGAYVPWFTVTAFLAGFLKGLIFMLIKNRDVKWLKAVLAVLVAVAAILGTFSFISLKKDGIIDGIYATSSGIPDSQELLNNKNSYSLPTKFAVNYAFDEWERPELKKPVQPETPEFITNPKLLEIKENESTKDYSKRLEGYSEQLAIVSDYVDDLAGYHSKLPRYDTLDDNGKKIYVLARDKEGTDQVKASVALIANIIAPGMIVFAVLGAILFAFMLFVEKKYQLGGFAAKIFISVLVAEIIQTSINSVLLMKLYGVTYQNFSYAVFNTPRIVEGVLMSMVLSYFIYLLYQVYESKIKGKLNII